MKDYPIISICIPTYKRPEILKRTILSILSENIDTNILDICITDNSKTNETKDMIDNEFANTVNLHYRKTYCEGFMNSIEALKYGDGVFLKLHNDYSMFKKGELKNFVNTVLSHIDDKPVLFFSMGALKKEKKIEYFCNFNDFLYDIHYYSTWSSAFCVWRRDLDIFLSKNIDIDNMFPHTSILYYLTYSSLYVVDDYEYVDNLSLKKKGGYNLPDNFARIYLTMTQKLLDNKIICKNTYDKIENGIIKFIAQWYSIVENHKDTYYFSFDNDERTIKKICGDYGLFKYQVYKLIYRLKEVLKRLK